MQQIKSRFQTFPCRKAYDQKSTFFFFKAGFIVDCLYDLKLDSTSGFNSKNGTEIS